MFGGLGIDEEMLRISNDVLNKNTTGIGHFPNIKQDLSGRQVDIEEIFNRELGDKFNYRVWKETLELQAGFNDRVAPGWKEDPNQNKYSYWMATLDEVVEVMNSKHWKWWKNSGNFGEVDWENVRVELIDIFHFMVSMALQTNMSEMIFTNLIANDKLLNEGKLQIRGPEFFKDIWEHLLMAVYLRSLPLLIVRWAEFWFKAGGDMDSLFKEYRIKAALNIIRQEYGYGTKNNYRKIWPSYLDKTQRVEDNVVAKQLTEDITKVDENTTQIITERLRRYYLERVAI